MTYEDIKTMVAGIGLPWAYYEFEEDTAEAPPFICYFFPERDDFFADNCNYSKIETLRIELYTAEKDFDTEDLVEAALQGAGLTYTAAEERIDDEQMYLKVYEMEVIINGEQN